MERNHLDHAFFPTHHRSQQKQEDQSWMMMRGGQLSSQSSGLSFDRGIEDSFAQMDLGNKVGNLGNAFLVGGENLVPRTDDDFYGLGFGSVPENGFYSPVESHFSTVHGNLESTYERLFYQAEVQRSVQMIEFLRRNNVPSRGHFRGEIGWPDSTSSGRNGLDLVGGNRVMANTNVAVDDVNLMDLRGEILALATDQFGCKLLQMKFGDIKEEEIEMVLEEVIDKVSSLMMDQFGNYLVQKLIEVSSEEQRTRIINSVTKKRYQLIRVCLNPHGTRVVQKLLENLTTEEQISTVILAISPGVVALIKDGNAYHVVQHCLRHFSEKYNRFLVNEIAQNCYEIATDKSGCCVLQLCVDITIGEVRGHLISEITANALQLSEDRYGNYVVQHLLLMKEPDVTSRLVNELQGHFFLLACNKYGSNVVEKCLTETGGEYSQLVILELLKTPGVSKLLTDPFGNYVYQSALSVSQGLLHNALVSLVEKHAASMSSNLYGKKVLAWFDNRKRLSHMYANKRS
ncbi:unnamed protein product [Rhodiola kirilowii]